MDYDNATVITPMPWWRYVLAVLAAVVLYLLAAPLFNIILILSYTLSGVHLPSPEWIRIICTCGAVAAALMSADYILKQERSVFSMVLSIVCAMYTLAVGVWNFALGTTVLIELIAMLAGSITAVCFAVSYGRRAKDL